MTKVRSKMGELQTRLVAIKILVESVLEAIQLPLEMEGGFGRTRNSHTVRLLF